MLQEVEPNKINKIPNYTKSDKTFNPHSKPHSINKKTSLKYPLSLKSLDNLLLNSLKHPSSHEWRCQWTLMFITYWKKDEINHRQL